MTYQTFDHARWVERNITYRIARSSSRSKYQPPEKLSEFQAKVMDILGMVFGGIYNAPISWGAVHWSYGEGIAVPLKRGLEMSTFDYHDLTSLVFLSHEARIRASVEPRGFGLRLVFHPRMHDGCIGQRHPNLDEAVGAFRKYLPEDHRIIYRAGGEG